MKKRIFLFSGYVFFLVVSVNAIEFNKYEPITVTSFEVGREVNHIMATLGEGIIFFGESGSGNIYLFDISGNGLLPVEPEIIDISVFKASIESGVWQTKLGSSVSLDRSSRLIIEGEISTVEYSAFIGFWNDKHDENSYDQPDVEITLDPEKFTRGYSMYNLGRDIDGNYYWSILHTAVLVFNPDGFLIDSFYIDRNDSVTIPALHPSGDVYFLGLNNSGSEISLNKIYRRW